MKAQITPKVREVGTEPYEEGTISNTTMSLLGTMDWLVAVSSVLLMICSSLLIANGTCSRQHAPSVSPAVCVGGHLSVQAWLAIVGVEFSVLGTVVIPRTASVFISKYLTKRLTGDGLRLPTLLNLQPSAPLRTQLLWGMKRVVVLRVLVVVLAGTGSILYKFSFTRVDMHGTFSIPLPPLNGGGYAEWQNTIAFGNSILQGPGYSPISINLLEVMVDAGTANGSSVLHLPINTSSSLLILGPKLNATSARKLLTGTVQSCVPYSYSRHGISWNWQVAYDTYPGIEQTPINNGVRFVALGNLMNYLVDVTSSPQGTLQAYCANGLDAIYPGNGHRYTLMIEVETKLCRGYTTWNTSNYNQDSSYQEYFLQGVQDIGCIPETFSFASWNASNSRTIAQSFVSAFTGAWDSYSTEVVEIVLASLDHSTLLASTAFTGLDTAASVETAPKACSGFSPAEGVAVGLLISNGTGMTLMGMILQGIALCFAMMGIVVLVWPSLPLVGEWPAQWLGLARGVDGEMVQRSLRGTSVGQNAAQGGDRLFLVSQHKVNGSNSLVFSTEHGDIAKRENYE